MVYSLKTAWETHPSCKKAWLIEAILCHIDKMDFYEEEDFLFKIWETH